MQTNNRGLSCSGASGLAVERIQAGHQTQLEELFVELSGDAASCSLFHPHPFTKEQAFIIAQYSGRDYYAGLFWKGKMAGYGMLRGWDEGFSIPSLGIVVVSAMRGRRLSVLLMEYLHAVARLEGASQIMLRVYKNNTHAVNLYRSMGYKLTELNECEWRGFVDVGPARMEIDMPAASMNGAGGS